MQDNRQAGHLELEGLGLLPGEALVGEVTVLGRLVVDGTGKVELLDNDTGTEIEVLANDLDQLGGRLVGSAVGLDEERQRLSDTNGVRELNQGTTSKLGVDQRLSDPAGQVCGRAVNLGVILSGESTTTVGTPTTVCVNDNLATGQTGVTLRTTNDEEAGGLDLVNQSGQSIECISDLGSLRGRRSCRPGTQPG